MPSMPRRVVGVKGEQRRHRRLDRVPERLLRNREPRRGTVATGRQQQALAINRAVVRQRASCKKRRQRRCGRPGARQACAPS